VTFSLPCIIQLSQTEMYMHKLLLLISIIFSLNCFSQAQKIKIKKEKEKISAPKYYNQLTLDLYYGNRVFDKSYYNQLNSIGHIDQKSPPMIIGAGFSGYNHWFKSRIMVIQANYYKLIPTRIMIEDTLNTKFSGYAYGFGVGPSLSSLKKNLNLNLYFGFNAGRTTLSKNDYITQKNLFFAPKITVQAKFIVKQIALSFIVEGEYDVTNPIWRQTTFERKDPHLLKPFHQTCFTGILSLGWRFY
jgi:hypothetical protein